MKALQTITEAIKTELKKAYDTAFGRTWPVVTAGILISVVAIFMFLWNSPWGIAGGYRSWGDWLLYLSGLSDSKPLFKPWQHPLSVSNFGIILGALSSALIAREFAIRKAPAWEYAKGAAGGILMGIGAVLASGCNVGGFYSAIGVFSAGGYAMMIGLGAGAYLGLKYLLWEMEHIPQKAMNAPEKKGKLMQVMTRIEPYFGAVIIFAVVMAFYASSSDENSKTGGLLFFGLLIGLVMHRSRFCFARAFREPLMTGESDMVKAVAASLLIYGAGSAVIKWNWMQPPEMGVYHPFWAGSLFGGLIFGFGMLLAGGCASSTLWRAAEGQTKLMLTLACFAITDSVTHRFITAYNLKEKLGTPYFLPDILGWSIAVPLLVAVISLWVIWADWNEETERFVLF